MVDWDEIKRLQDDLEEVQQSATMQRLSERNCVEILMKLEEMKLINMFHSTDGKEYITPDHLLSEIQQEVEAQGGRINIVDLPSLLNVDFSIIEPNCKELVKRNKSIKFAIGQLVSNFYLDRIAEEINDNLRSDGHVSIGKLSQLYDLPGDFIIKEMSSRMGSIIEAKLDTQTKDTIFTDSFITRHKCRIRGMISAATRPISVAALSDQDFSQQLTSMIIEELSREGRIKGQLGTSSAEGLLFSPLIYSQTQIDWIGNFFTQNNYIEYSMAAKFGGNDSTVNLRRRLDRYNPVFLKTVCVGNTLVEQVESLVEDTLSNKEWSDISVILPSSFTNEDIRQLLEHVGKDKTQKIIILCDVIATSRSFIDSCISYFDSFIEEKAKKEASKTTILDVTDEQRKELMSHVDSHKRSDKKEERRRRAHEGSGSLKKADYGGSGQGGREVKSKGIDKKKLRWQREHEEKEKKKSQKHKEDSGIERNEVEALLHEKLDECPDCMVDEIASYILESLNAKYQTALKSVFTKQQSGNVNTEKGVGVVSARISRKHLEEEVNRIWFGIQIFKSSFSHFTEDSLSILHKHLLQTVCTELTDALFMILTVEFIPAADVTPPLSEQTKLSLLPRFPIDMRPPMTRLNSLLTGKKFDAFLEAFQEAISPKVCDVLVKAMDKKKEKQLLHGHKMSLLEQLQNTTDPAICFHLCISILFQSFTGSALNIPGRLIPTALESLQDFLERDIFVELMAYQERIVKFQTLEDADKEENLKSLSNDLPRMKELAATLKKKT